MSTSAKPEIEIRNKFKIKKWIGLILAFAALLLIILMPHQQGLSQAGQNTLAVFVFAFILWVTQAVNMVVSSIMIFVVMAVLKIGDTASILSGFSSKSPITMLGAFLIAAGVSESGLANRIAYKILQRFHSRNEMIFASFIVISFILTPFLPAAAGRAALLLPLATGILGVLGAKEGSNSAKMLLAGGIGFSQGMSSNLFITGMSTNLLALDLIQKGTGVTITYSHWLLAGLPLSILPPVFVYLVYRWIYPPEKPEVGGDLTQYIEQELKALGPITRNEKVTIVILALALFFWVTGLFGFSGWVVAVTAGALFQMPGIEITTWRKAKDFVPWQIFILFAVAISLGNFLFKTKSVNWLTDHTLLAWGMGSWGWVLAMFVILLGVHLIHAGIISAGPMLSLLIPPLIIFAQKIGWDPVALSLLVIANIHMPNILPISLEPSMIVFGSGYYKFTDTVRPGIILTVIWILLSLACAAFWPWLKIL